MSDLLTFYRLREIMQELEALRKAVEKLSEQVEHLLPKEWPGPR